jgi:hypothetical protein
VAVVVAADNVAAGDDMDYNAQTMELQWAVASYHLTFDSANHLQLNELSF